MTQSQSMVLYRPSSGQTTLSTTTTYRSLVPSRFFTASTGTAIATELLYRILIDIINRILHSVQRFTSTKIDEFSSFLERRRVERQNERLEAAKAAKGNAASGNGGGLRIVEEVGRVAEERGFIQHCPMTGREWEEGGRGPPEPPRWVKGVLKGVEEGRMEERDFWIHTHTG